MCWHGLGHLFLRVSGWKLWVRVLAYQPGFGDLFRLVETNRFDVLAAQAKTLASSGEIRAGAGPGVAIQRDGVAAVLAYNHPGAVGQNHHMHLTVHQGSLRPGQAVVLELVLQNGGCGNHRVCISLLSCQETNVWGLVSDVDWVSRGRLSQSMIASLSSSLQGTSGQQTLIVEEFLSRQSLLSEATNNHEVWKPA